MLVSKFCITREDLRKYIQVIANMQDRPHELGYTPSPPDRKGAAGRWMRTQYRIFMDFFAIDPKLERSTELPIQLDDTAHNWATVSWESIQRNLGSPDWPIDRVTQHDFLETTKDMYRWFIGLKKRFLGDKLPIAGVFHPEKLKPLSRDERVDLKTPLTPAVAVQTLESLTGRVFIPEENARQQIGRRAWHRIGQPVDTFINSFVLNSLWQGRRKTYRGLYGIEKTIGNFWRTMTRMQPLGSGEGSSSLHVRGEVLEKISSYDDLAYAMTTLGGVSLDYWDKVNERYQALLSEQREIHSEALSAVEESALEIAHLEGIYPEACVNNGLEVESVTSETLLTQSPRWIRKLMEKRLTLTREKHTPIEMKKAKVMYVDAQGNILLVPASAIKEDQARVAELVSEWLKSGSEKPQVAAVEGPEGWDVWECLKMASSGYGKSADTRYQAISLVDAKGSQLRWSEALKDVVCTLVASDKEEVHKTWSLSVPDVFQFKTGAQNGRVNIKELISFKGHGFMDGMPHSRELGAILGEFRQRMNQTRPDLQSKSSSVDFDEFRQRHSLQQARLSLDGQSSRLIDQALRSDIYWEGPRMLARTHLDITHLDTPDEIDSVELVRATKRFAGTVGQRKYEDNRRFELARDWVNSTVNRRKIERWAKVCGQEEEWIKGKIVEFIARNAEGVPDLTQITPAFLMGLAKVLTMSHLDLPVDHLAVEAHQMEGFVNGRMGAALMVLDEDLAAAFNLAYLEPDNSMAQWYFQKILADRAIKLRGGTAQVQTNKGLIASVGSYMDPEVQPALKRLTGILPGRFSRPPPARILTGSGITSILTPLKEGFSLFDPNQRLNSGLYDRDLHIYKFRTVSEGQPEYGFCIGGLQDQASDPTTLTETDPETKEEKTKTYYGYSLDMSLNEPLLMKWLLDPGRRRWLNEVLAIALSKGGKPKLHLLTPLTGGDAENERLLRLLYRTNRDVRERLQPVFDGLAAEVKEHYKIILLKLIDMLSREPKGPLGHYGEPLQQPELEEMKKIARAACQPFVDGKRSYWNKAYSSPLDDAIAKAQEE